MSFSSTGGGGADLGSARGEIRIDTAAANRDVKKLSGTLGQFGNDANASFSRVATGLGLLAVSAGIFKGLLAGVGIAADFEQQMSAIEAVAGATTAEMELLRQKAIQIGKDTAFSASQGAGALEELLKAGVSVKDVLGGAADGAVALAAAAGIGLPEAASLIATSLNQYQLGGDQATRFADLFAAAASSSSASAEEIGRGFAYAGGQAHLLGISAEDLTTSLAILADSGLGDRAGTSLNSALGSLAAPSDIAKGKLAELGVEVFDLQGNFKPLPDLIQELADKVGGLSKEGQIDALQDIFDEQGMRAIIPLINAQTDDMDKLGKGWEQYATKVTKGGAAAEQARIRMDNTRGSLEQLKGSVETFAIIVGSTLLPAVREIVDGLTAVVNVLIGMPQSFQVFVGLAIASAGALAGIAGAMVLIGPKAAAFAKALHSIRIALLGMNPIVLAVVAALLLFGAAYKTNFGGFADTVDKVAGKLKQAAHVFTVSFQQFGQLKELGKSGAIIAALTQGLGTLFGKNLYKQAKLMGKAFANFGEGIGRVGRQFKSLSKIIKAEGLGAGLDRLFGDIGRKMLDGIGESMAALPKLIGTTLTQIKTGFGPLDSIVANTGRAFQQFGRAIENVFAGDFGKAADNLTNAFGRMREVATGGIDLGVIIVKGAFNLIGDLAGNFWDWLRMKIGMTELAGFPGMGGSARVVPAGGFIPFLTILVDGAFALAGDLLKWAGNIWGWLKEQLGFTQTEPLDIGTVAVKIGGWFVDAGTGLWDKVSEAALAAWELAKSVATDIEDVAINAFNFVVRSGAGIWDAVDQTVRAAWELVKTDAILIGDVVLDLVAFVGTFEWSALVDWGSYGKALIDDAVAGLKDFFALDEEQSATAGDVGFNIGQAITDAVIKGIVEGANAGGDGGGGDGGGGGGPGLGNEDLKGFDFIVRRTLEGISGTIDKAMTDWLGEPSDVPGKISQKLEELFVDPFTSGGGQQGFIDRIGKIGSFIRDAFDSPIADLQAFDAQLVTWAGQLFDAAGTAVSTAWRELIDFFTPDFSGWEAPSMPDWFTNTVDWLDTPVDALLSKLRDVFTGGITLKKGFGGAKLVETKGIFDDLFESLFGEISLPDFPDIGGAFVTWVTGELAEISNSLLNNVAVKIAAAAMNGDWREVARLSGLGFGGGGGGGGGSGLTFENFPNPQGDVALQASIDFWQKVIENTPSGGGGGGGGQKKHFIDAGTTFGKGIGDGVVIGINSRAADVASALRRLASGSTDPTAKSKDFREPDKVKLAAPDATAFLKGLADAVVATRTTSTRIVEAMQRLIGPLTQAGQLASRGFATGIQIGMSIAIQAAANGAIAVSNAARNNLGSLGAAGFGVGQSLGFGIANGINSTIAAVAQAAANLVSQALNAAKQRAAIGSPSRLFEKQVGLPIAQGMEVGIRSGTGLVQRSIADLIGSSIPTTSASSMLGRQPIGAAAAGPRGGGGVINMFMLKSADLVELMRGAENGNLSQGNWENLERSYSLVMGN